MKDLLFLSAMFGWPLAIFAGVRLSAMCRCAPNAVRWGYIMVLAGATLQAFSPWTIGHGMTGVLAASRFLIVGLLLLASGLLTLLLTLPCPGQRAGGFQGRQTQG